MGGKIQKYYEAEREFLEKGLPDPINWMVGHGLSFIFAQNVCIKSQYLPVGKSLL